MLTFRYPTQPWEVLLHKPGHKFGAFLCLEVDLFHNLTLNMGALLELALIPYHKPTVCLETLLFWEGKCSEATHITVLANKHNFNTTFQGPTSRVSMLMEGDLILTISNKTRTRSNLQRSRSWPLWIFPIYLNWSTIQSGIRRLGLLFRQSYHLTFPNLKEKWRKTPTHTSWPSIYGVPRTRWWMTMLGWGFSKELWWGQLQNGISNYQQLAL